MGSFLDALKAGVHGFKTANDPAEYSVGGRPVRCPHCGERKFYPRTALLNTRARSAFNIDWADPGAAILICAECSRLEWFVQEPERIE